MHFFKLIIMIFIFMDLYIMHNTFRMNEDIKILKLIDQSKTEITEYAHSEHTRKLNGRLFFHIVPM